PDRAMQDPVVRQRLTAPAVTQPDLRAGIDRPAANGRLWYLRCSDRQGGMRITKLTFTQVIQRLRDGKLTIETQAARLARGDFKPLKTYVEFQEAVPPALLGRSAAPAQGSAPFSSKILYRWLAFG